MEKELKGEVRNKTCPLLLPLGPYRVFSGDEAARHSSHWSAAACVRLDRANVSQRLRSHATRPIRTKRSLAGLVWEGKGAGCLNTHILHRRCVTKGKGGEGVDGLEKR